MPIGYLTLLQRNGTSHADRHGHTCPSATAMRPLQRRRSDGPPSTISHELLSSKHKSSSLGGTAPDCCVRRNPAATPDQCGRPPGALPWSSQLARWIPSVLQVAGRCVGTAAILYAAKRALLSARSMAHARPPWFAPHLREDTDAMGRLELPPLLRQPAGLVPSSARSSTRPPTRSSAFPGRGVSI